MKIGMYSSDEIYDELANGFLHRSMVDAMYFEIKKLRNENQQLKEKLNCKEYFSSTMPKDTEFVILTKNNYDRQQKDLALENIKLKKQKCDVVEYIKKNNFKYCDDELCYMIPNHFNNLLRMLGEIDE